MGAPLERQPEQKPKTAADLTLPELREIAAGIGGSVTPIDTEEMTGYILSQPRIQLDIFFNRKPHIPPQTLVGIGGLPTINLGNPRINISPRSVTFVNEEDLFRDIFIVTPDLYGHSRIANGSKRG